MTGLRAFLVVALLFVTSLSPVPALAEEGDAGELEEREEEAPEGEDEGEDERREEEEDDEADDREDEGEEVEDAWEREERELELRVEEDRFEYESRRASELGEDEVRVRFDAGDGRLTFEFEAEQEGGATELELELDRWRLIEYEDEDGNRRLEAGETVHQRLGIEQLEASPLQHKPRDGASHVTAAYQIPTGGSLSLAFVVTPRPVKVGNLTVAPTELKFDVLIQDFPYSSETSQLALEVRASSSAETEVDRGQPGLLATAGGIQGFVRWVDHAEVDGVTSPVPVDLHQVAASQDGSEREEVTRVTFHYPRGASVHHDPSLGVSLASTGVQALLAPFGDWRFLALGLAAGGLLVAVTLVPRTRYS